MENDQAAKDLADRIDDLIKNNPDIIDQPDLLKSPEVKESLTSDKIDSIQNQLDNINEQLLIDPTNAELMQKKLDLEKQLEEFSEKRNEEKLDEDVDVPAVPELELKQINLDPIRETQGIMMNKFPFRCFLLPVLCFLFLSPLPWLFPLKLILVSHLL